MTGDNSLAAGLFTVLCLGAAIGVAAVIQAAFTFHRRGVARLRANRNRQEPVR